MTFAADPARLRLAAPSLLAALALRRAGCRASASRRGRARAASRGLRPQAVAARAASAPMQAVRGRILYDFSGSACEGYALQFRQVSELDTGEGKVDGERPARHHLGGRRGQEASASIRRTIFDQQAARIGRRPGRARTPAASRCSLTKPATRSSTSKTDLVFPTEHMRRIIAAAREGKTLLEVAGLRRLGERREGLQHAHRDRPPIPPDEQQADRRRRRPGGARRLTRWPVTISYFDQAPTARAASRRRSIPSPSSSTRTASRARSCSTTAISSSAAR